MQEFTGVEYLKIDVANCFGLDRLNWEDRIHWFNNNEPHLEDLAIHAKSAILYRKAIRAMREVQRGNKTNHIMGLDATASGIQIMGACSGCYSTARAVNLVNTGQREDLYSFISDNMNRMPTVDVNRDTLKKPIMTSFYGSTAQPKEVFGETDALVAFYTALREELPGAYELKELLLGFWDYRATEHSWRLPDGHIARVPVTQTQEKSLEIDEAEHLRFAYRAQVIAPKLESRSLPANVVHSIDAWVVRQMVRAARIQGFWMAPIHDCFYASPNNMNHVRANYIKILQWLADNPPISRILSDITGRRIGYRQKSRRLGKEIAKAEYALS